MDRDVDRYDNQCRRPAKFSNNPLVWKRIWKSCCAFLENFKYTEIFSFHQLICHWMPVINAHMHYPLPSLEQYNATFHYLNEPSDSKEILHLWVDPHAGRKSLFIVFNVPLFKKLLSLVNQAHQGRSSHLVDADRGTVSFDLHVSINPIEFLKRSTTWYLLFLSTCHALAHLDCYEKYDTASYDKHDFLKKSVFYNMYVVGTVKHIYQ